MAAALAEPGFRIPRALFDDPEVRRLFKALRERKVISCQSYFGDILIDIVEPPVDVTGGQQLPLGEQAIAQEFEMWYRHYPHKVGKLAARKAFLRARRQASLEHLIDGLMRYIALKPVDRDWCHPATWLNGGRWLDKPATGDGQRLDQYAQRSAQKRAAGDDRRERALAALDRAAGMADDVAGVPAGAGIHPGRAEVIDLVRGRDGAFDDGAGQRRAARAG